MRSIKGSVLYKCVNCVVVTLLEEDHPVSETRTTKNTDSQWSTDGHFNKECAHHVRVTLQQVIQYSLPPLSLSLSLSLSLTPSLTLSLSLSATCRVYRTISRASGLFNVVIQAEHNCVPPSDRRLRTSSLLTKKPATQRWGQAHLREEIFLCPPPPSLSLFLFSWLGEKKGSKDNGCLITM